LVTLKVWLAGLLPTIAVKDRLVGKFEMPGPAPVPWIAKSKAVSVNPSPVASSVVVKFSVALRVPRPLGSKRTTRVVVPLGATDEDGCVITRNSAACVPLVVTLPTVKAVLPVFEMVKVRSKVALSTPTAPKSVWSAVDGVASLSAIGVLLPSTVTSA
jgi:hypothetical protein